MIDAQITRATCEVKCGEDSGTGWLVTSSQVITARHCVTDAISEDAQINLSFGTSGSNNEVVAVVLAEREDLDVCLLQLSHEIKLPPILLSETLPIEGSSFSAFGFPVAKLSVGQRIEGSISRVLDSPTLTMDLDLHVDASAALSEYEGISGAALICDGLCRGLLRIAVDKSLGAISVSKMADFLREHSIPVEGAPKEAFENQEQLASRENFTEEFDSLIRNVAGGYAFIEGVHGIGKSTFCENYRPLDPALQYFGTYSFSSRESSVNTMHQAQPDVFFDWLNTHISSHLTGKAGRVSVKSYSDLISGTRQLFELLGQSYLSQDQIGVIFIDGLDEVAKLGEEALSKLVGLLPPKMPAGLALVISGPNYANLSAVIGSRMGNQACITMPSLIRSEERDFCVRALQPERFFAETVRIICDRAQGHPLYLRYLIDLANKGCDDEHLATLPLIHGSIRNYYERLWLQLNRDSDVVNLLAIIARLRWGISTQQLAEILNDAERMALVSTFERIQHLLLKHEETTIYHSSFGDFLIEKTELRDPDIQYRLAQYCQSNPATRYGKLNVVYHGLKSRAAHETLAVAACNQEWADQCVTLGIEPDVLLSDVEDALAAAAHQGNLLEVVRLLLLAQRLQFRYDTLFAQSADLAADALLSLGKTQEAVQHVIRYGRLIVPVDDALCLAFHFISRNEINDAMELLDATEAVLERQLSISNQVIADFVEAFEQQVLQLLLRNRAGDDRAMDVLMKFLFSSMHTIKYGVQDERVRKAILLEMVSHFFASTMCLSARYTPLTVIRERLQTSLDWEGQVLLHMLAKYRAYCEYYSLVPDQSLLSLVFADLQTLLVEVGSAWDEPKLNIVDAVVSLGAPRDLVAGIANKDLFQNKQFGFVASDNVTMDESLFTTGMAQWRLASLLDNDFPCPSTEEFHSSEWLKEIDLIGRSLAWCDGAARRAKEHKDDTGLQEVWFLLEQQVFKRLRFTLAQRVEWVDSYALPEAVFPHLYKRLIDLLSDIFPERLGYMLTFIDDQFSTQCGLYSEGFRAIVVTALDMVCKQLPLSEETEDKAWRLLLRWQEFVQTNIKNRHELVPELLALIPLFARMNSSEEADRTYQTVLAVSMGPDWYKEDQLSLMTGVIGHIPMEETLEAGVLSRIASLLEAASGEMTFQCYVQYDKADLLEILCKRGDYSKAVHYLLRQTCGTAEQMLAEVSEGEIDRISPLKGMRFPGGALDEQEAIYRILRPAISLGHWPLCWALLEIYQFGDRRHVRESAKLYALLIEKINGDSLKEMTRRLKLICETELASHQREEFLSYLCENLPADQLKLLADTLNVPLSSSQNQKQTVVDHSYDEGDLNKGEVEGDRKRDMMLMPGVFGTQDSIQCSEEALSKAERYLSRRNTSSAQNEARTALEHLQRGGWSIWGNPTSGAKRAKEILLQETESIESIVKLYAPLILDERYTERWRRANHLIDQLAAIATRDERATLAQIVIEHVETIIGCNEVKNGDYESLEDTYADDVSTSLIQLLMYTLDHPQWLRREKAAEMVLWLLESHPEYIPIVGPAAFTMESTNCPDIICGVLDHLSQSSAKKLWNQLAPALNFEDIRDSCKHIGRRTVLLQIVDRAIRQDVTNAIEIKDLLREEMPLSLESTNNSTITKAACPEWALVAGHQWHELGSMGLATTELVAGVRKVLESVCAPIELETYIELERLLAEGFRDNLEHPLGRWMAKIRYALQVTLFTTVTKDLFPRIEQILRPYNPTRINRFRITNFSSPTKGWITALRNQKGNIKPINGSDVYLDFLERVWIEGQWKLFRLTAFFYDPKVHSIHPPQLACFSSTEQAKLDDASWFDCCVSVDGVGAFFGSFTPAIPSNTLMKITGATSADIHRAYWRSGRAPISLGGGPEHEGCSLSIKSNALRTINGAQLAWVYQVDGRPLGMTTYA